MNYLREYRKPLAIVTAAAFMAVSAPMPVARAALVSTDRVITAEQGSPRAKLNAFLSREDVQDQMRALGVSPDEAKARVASMSDEEVANVQGKLDSMPAGQGFFGALLGVGLIVFLVLLVTDLLGLTHVFSFTNKGSARNMN